MKRIIAAIAALALSVSLASCGSNSQTSESNQANAIKAACELANAKDYEGTLDAFAEIAAIDSGYIGAAMGARAWANAKGGNIYGMSYVEDVKPIVYKSFLEFYALCTDIP